MPSQAKKGKEPAVDDLERFVWAQEGGELGTFKTGLAEIASGAKVTCWIWYVLPQIEDPGRRSANNTRYGLHAKAEITDYLRHPVLAARYVSIWDAALAVLRKAHKKCQNPSSKFGTLLKLFGGNVDTRKAYHSLSTMALGSLSMGKPSRAPADVPPKQEEGAHEEAPPPYLWEPTTWQAYFANALSVFVVEYLDGVMATCEAAGRKHNFERCLRLKRNIKPPRRTSNDKADTTTELKFFEGAVFLGEELPSGFLLGCNRLTHVDLGPFRHVTSVGTDFLSQCSKLESADLAPLSNVVRIGGSFMFKCISLRTLDTAPLSNVERVGEFFLGFCTALFASGETSFLAHMGKATFFPRGFLEGCPNADELKQAVMLEDLPERPFRTWH